MPARIALMQEMQELQNLQEFKEVKGTVKNAFDWITSEKLLYVLFLVALAFILVKLVGLIFRPLIRSKKKSVQMSFMKTCIQALIIITFGFKILSLFSFMKEFASQILMSSSLIVVILGFVFQEGLSNIVHGFILSVFNPFQLGDRINVKIDGETITGYVKSIDLRHTVIQNVMNSSHVIVPNRKMDLSIIDNSYFDNNVSSNFLDLSITYESDLMKAIRIISETVDAHPLVAEAKKRGKITAPTSVIVRELSEKGISLRAVVYTCTIEENFTACSDLRRDLVLRFQKEGDVRIAYPHVQLLEPFVSPSDPDPVQSGGGNPGMPPEPRG